MSKPIPFLSLKFQVDEIRKNLDRATRDVLDSGQFLLGKRTDKFEREYASFTGVSYGAAVGNGHDAIQLALRSIGVGQGDEVIVPSNTCMPTWLAVAATGARVVPVEPSKDTYNITAETIRPAITSRTRAIVPVHLYGQACRMDEIMKLASERNVSVVEDNAQGHGSSYRGQLTGSFGIVNATSFYPTKNLGAFGDGGAVTTNDPDIDARIRRLRNYGSYAGVAGERGINSRLDELQAAVLSVKLRRLRAWNKLRRAIAKRYFRELENVPDLILPVTAEGCDHVFHLFVIRTGRRDELKKYLGDKGIQTQVHYEVPPHLQPAFGDYGFKPGRFPVAAEISGTCLSLPCWPGMNEQQVSRVAGAIRQFFSSRK